MAIYPISPTDRLVAPQDLQACVGAIFEKCGMSSEDAALLARTLVHSDLRGVHSHGVIRVPDYVKKLRQDGVDPRGRPAIASERRGALVVDGGNSMGQIGGTFAMRRAIEKARDFGVAFAAVRGSNHCGAMDWYTLMAANAQMIGIAGTNAIPTMSPWGGTDKIVGINPLSIAIPAARHPHFVLDCAFGATAHGKIRIYAQKGSPIPEGWAFDAEGRPTTDAAKALTGLIQPIGQHKGVGLGMAIGMLSTLLSGAAYGTRVGDMTNGAKPGVDGHFFAALDISAFADPAEVTAQVDAIIDEVHASRPREGVERLRVPGEIEAEFELEFGRRGIPLTAATLEDIAKAARLLGVAIPKSLTAIDL
jgi:LDH2 family malate/lactate/ureidoglycolate dehydrogenase